MFVVLYVLLEKWLARGDYSRSRAGQHGGELARR